MFKAIHFNIVDKVISGQCDIHDVEQIVKCCRKSILTKQNKNVGYIISNPGALCQECDDL